MPYTPAGTGRGLRHDLLRAYDASRIIDLLQAGRKAPESPRTHHLLLDQLTKQATVLAESGGVRFARHVAGGLEGL
jgi:hypothetical protein